MEEAYRGDGASQYYVQGGDRVVATIAFTDAPEETRRGIPIKSVAIYTTSALFAEGKDDIERWAGQGFSAVVDRT